MKGIIILPKYLETLWTPKTGVEGPDFNTVLSNSAPFYYAIRDTFKFELKYADEVDVDSNTDIVIMFGVPYHNRPKLIPGFLDLNKNIKLVMCPGDIQCYGNEICLENRIKVFERCNLIIVHTYEYFAKIYPQFLSKHLFMHNYFSPHERYMQLLFNDKPKMKCLLSGAINKKVYTLRALVKNCEYVDYKPANYVGDSYARLLNSYFCCVTSSSIFNYVVAKYFEIPAAGSLLLADETEDLKMAGFIPYKHYVPITKKDAYIKITECLKNPENYNDIRREGMEFVHKNHSVINRMELLKVVFDNLMGD
jgi:hypothetical protein